MRKLRLIGSNSEDLVRRATYARRPDLYLDLNSEDKLKFEPTDADCRAAGYRDLNQWHNEVTTLVIERLCRDRK